MAAITPWLRDHSFQARPFYERHGYTVFGTLDNYPIGHSRCFMQKAFAVATTKIEPRTKN